MKKTGTRLSMLIFLLTVQINVFAQENKLYELGESLLSLNKTNNPDKIVDFIDPNLDLDKKAEIMESFLKTKDIVFDKKDAEVKLFNVIKSPKNVFFIIIKNGDFIIVKSKLNDQNQIISHFAIVKNDVSEKIKKGQKIFKLRCYSCHRKNGEGGIASNLTDPYWIFVKSEKDLYDVIKNGKKGTMMIAFKDYLSPEEIDDVITYIKTLQGKKVEKPKKPEGEKQPFSFDLLK